MNDIIKITINQKPSSREVVKIKARLIYALVALHDSLNIKTVTEKVFALHKNEKDIREA